MALKDTKKRDISELERKSLRSRQRMGLEEKGSTPRTSVPGLTKTLEIVKGDTGSQGPSGSEGKQGPKGEVGIRGPQGLTGSGGTQGQEGKTGLKGNRGDKGAIGERGEIGPVGSAGKVGSDGKVGLTGKQGTQGVEGIQGSVGKTGAAGSVGSQGEMGEKGSLGSIGKRGIAGVQGVAGISGLRGDRGFTGEKGLKGERGSEGTQGIKGEHGSKGERGLEGRLSDDDRVRFFVGLQRAKYTDAEAAAALLVLVTKTSNYTIVGADNVIICDASGGAFTVTLPTAVGRGGKVYNIKKIDSTSNIVRVSGDGTETIDDGTTADLTVQYEAITIISDGTEWWIL